MTMMSVPFLRLDPKVLGCEDEIRESVDRVLSSGFYVLGQELQQFEESFAVFCEAKYCVGVGSGLDALVLALLAIDVKPGDYVIVPSNTYIASWLAVSHVGARPLPVEPDKETALITREGIERAVRRHRVAAIMPVHLYGNACNMPEISLFAQKNGIPVVEDAAQAHGARAPDGQRVGSHGDVVAWSFYPGKNLGAMGDAGGITTNNSQIADRVRVLRNYGSRIKYWNEVRGFNSRLDEVQAAVLNVKLRHLERWNNCRQEQAARYDEALKELWVEPLQTQIPQNSARHLYVIQSQNRNYLSQMLSEAGVESIVHYPVPPHLQEAYSDEGFQEGDFPIAETLAEKILSLPIGPHLNDHQQSYVIKTIKLAERAVHK